ncbi:MAG: hypothetical protein DRN20_02830 [Thermoplasmata archaeon]|nr:MAG: hypothetical protein DRN20_02830 [Thermoplasmata archaeon]
MGEREGEEFNILPDIEELVPVDEKAKAIKEYVRSYLDEYRKVVEGEKPEILPDFYEHYPYSVIAICMPNDTVCVLFRTGAPQLEIIVRDGDFAEVRKKLQDRWCDYFMLLLPDRMGVDDAKERARADALHDLSVVSKRLRILSLKKELAKLEEDFERVIKINPWLEEEAKEQKSRIENLKSLIDTLTKEVKEEFENRYDRYIKELESVRFIAKQHAPDTAEEGEVAVEGEKKEEMMEVRGEKKVVVEKVVDLPPEIKNTIFRMNRRLYRLEKQFEPFEASIKGKVETLKKRVDALEKSIKTLERTLNDTKHVFVSKAATASKVGKASIVVAIIAILLALLSMFDVLPKFSVP